MTGQAQDTRGDGHEGTPAVFRDPNETAVQEVGIRLLREILDYQQRLTQLLARDASPRSALVKTYRRAIRVRREMLRDLPLDAGPPRS